MIKNRFLLLTLLCFFSVLLKAGKNNLSLAVFLIPDSLKSSAYAVVRSETTDFELRSATSATQKVQLALTVLDSKGKDYAHFHFAGDKNMKLSAFKARIYDAMGVELQKFGMTDIKTSEWSDAYTLAQDLKHYFFDCQAPVLPFSIVYEYSIEYTNGVLGFPAFVPQDNYHLSVENSTYKLNIPEGLKYRIKTQYLPEKPALSNNPKEKSLTWTVSGLKAVEQESYSMRLDELVPLLYIYPENFVYDGVKGEFNDWNGMGNWIKNLLEQRDELPEAAKIKVQSLVSNAKTDGEKVKILYDYLGQSTRYVSIQLGIGGYQPMTADEVYRTGFGDCKALTNYLKAMLKVAGIQSTYTVVRLDNKYKTLYPDFANFNQMNHVVLQVPLPQDTLWLECTNTQVPFGFVHNGISGHMALAIESNGGRVCKIPDYNELSNEEANKAEIVFSEVGKAQIKAQKICKNEMFDVYDDFSKSKPTEQTDLLRKGINLAQATISNIKFIEKKTTQPELEINYECITENYGNRTGNRFFIPINPFRNGFTALSKNKRKNDIVINNGYYDTDSLIVRLPQGFKVETLPANTYISTAFGSFRSTIRVENNQIYINQALFLQSGKWDVTEYSEFSKFLSKITENYKSKIVIVTEN